MHTYIHNSTNKYVTLDAELDNNSNLIASDWAGYQNGGWLLLSPEQIAFKEANPTANKQEVYNMMLADLKPHQPDALELAKAKKLAEISAQDDFSNKFFVSVMMGGAEIANQEFWIDKDLRNSLYSITLPALIADGEETTKLWTTSKPPVYIEVPIAWTMEKLPLLEIYAKRTYDLRAKNEADVYNATTVEEVEQIDVKAGYPLFLTFELNLG